MRTRTRFFSAAILAVITIFAAVLLWPQPSPLTPAQEKFLGKSRTAAQRANFEQMRTKDPATGRIPKNIRSREVAFASRLPKQQSFFSKSSGAVTYTQDWAAVGPFNAGGRTRALAFDMGYDGVTNRKMLAGGVSGGMFISEDAGASWTLTTGLQDLASVTALAQDPSNHDVWYYGTGEFFGSSAAGGGNFAHLGHGIFKSTDGGNSWTQLAASVEANNPASFDSQFDIIWRLAVTDQGTVLAAVRAGIMRSTDGGASWESVLLGSDANSESTVTDVIRASDGTLYAALSLNGGTHLSGIFASSDDGATWTDMSPSMLAADSYRMQLASPASDPTTLYLLSQKNQEGAVSSDLQLLRFNAATFTWSDTNFELNATQTEDEGGVNAQGGYNLVLAVKPDDPETIWVGGTNLTRSTDGGQTWEWVGGYDPTGQTADGTWEGHFPDQHAIAFAPGAPEVMLSGNDGGIAITTNNLELPQTWTSLNNGYVVTQFYSMSVVPDLVGDTRMLGGLQDQDSYLRPASAAAEDDWQLLALGADGADAAFARGGSPLYISAQNGAVIRIDSTDPLDGALVQPAGTEEGAFLFVTPYVLDPNDTDVMYMAVGSGVARNSDLMAIPTGNQEPTDINWTVLEGSMLPGDMSATALAVSTEPAGRLYFGGTDQFSTTTLVRVDDAAADGAGLDITPPDLLAGSYISYIGINPEDADEILVTASNYGVPSIFHSSDGGATWSDVEGNLAGDDGPSVRSAVVIPTTTTPVYLVSTSTGVYGATELAGAATVWAQQGADVIGNAVVDELAFRAEDGFLAAGSHGRGAFSAFVSVSGSVATEDGSELPRGVALRQNYPNPFAAATTITYELATPGAVRLDVFDARGRVIQTVDQGAKPAGTQQATFNASELAAGTYFYRLTILGDNGVPLSSETRSMALVK